MKDRIKWRRSWFPAYYGFCPTEAAWKRAMLDSHEEGTSYPSHDGCCTAYDDKQGVRRIIVTLHSRLEKDDPNVVLGVLVHECVHVIQWIKQTMVDNEASWEFEAYATQAVFMELLEDVAGCGRFSPIKK